MGQEPDEIKKHIDAQRQQLGDNLDILEGQVRHMENRVKHEVRRAMDWRTWVERKPLLALGAAFAGGVWLATRK